MKFGKELAGKMVPEWQEAYMNYNFLKSLLEDLRNYKQMKRPGATSPKGLSRTNSLYRAFSGLTRSRRISGRWSPPSIDTLDDHVILVKAAKHDDGGGYVTEFLNSSEEGGEYELMFFRRLDDEFNKVDKFYQRKVEHVLEEASSLNKQMEALVAFRIRVADPEGSVDWSVEMNRLRTNIASSRRTDIELGSTQEYDPTTHGHHMVAIEESEQSLRGHSGEELDDNTDIEETNTINKYENNEAIERKIVAYRPAPLDILNHVKLNSTRETPAATIRGVLKIKKNRNLKFKLNELKKIEDQLKQAFAGFYQKLLLLKSYSFQNMLAFSKILKKYDKITSRNASKPYLKMVDDSFLGNSDEINRLIERVESTFIKHFANGNRNKGIKILRPTQPKEKHRVTYSLGFFSGCVTALLVAVILIIRARDIIGKQGSTQYMETMFPLYSLFGFIVLHMLLYGGNIYFWRRYRVNYPFIFGFKHGSGLSYRQVFLLSAILATLSMANVLANLDMEMDEKTKDYKTYTELLPLVLVCSVLVVVFCPFNIIYRSSRFFLLRSAFRALCAPLYTVTLPDFFVADQLTSQVQAMRSFSFYICYYGWGDFRHRKDSCSNNDVYITFGFLIAAFPFWLRFLQCVRRFFEEKDKTQGVNSLKYFTMVVAVCMRTAYSRNDSLGWKVLAWIFSILSGVVLTYWDIVYDWGLLNRKSKNPWLRDKLLVPHKSVYFAAIVSNIVFRFAWLQTMLNFEVSFLHNQALVAVVASLEVIRRGVWNFFRLENEHLNNIGKYRAFKSVPLPFTYEEEKRYE